MKVIKDDGLASMVEVVFSDLIKKYQLKIIEIDESEVFIAGINYVLLFSASQENLDDVFYIERNDELHFNIYTLRPLEVRRFTQEDRICYGSPATIKERWMASLNVLASGLGNKCHDILSGNKSWINDSLRSGRKISNTEMSVLLESLPILSQN